jgi:hypothetical protein
VWAALGALAGWLLVHLVLLSPTKATACLFRLSTTCTLLLGAALPALAGVLYAIALVGADACVAPVATLTGLLNSTAAGIGSPLAASTLAYFATCASGAPAAPGSSSGASAQVAAASAALALATAQVSSLNATVLLDPALLPLTPALGSITGDIASANATIAALTGTTLACSPVSAMYTALLTALCGGAVNGIALTFLPVVVASVAGLPREAQPRGLEQVCQEGCAQAGDLVAVQQAPRAASREGVVH